MRILLMRSVIGLLAVPVLSSPAMAQGAKSWSKDSLYIGNRLKLESTPGGCTRPQCEWELGGELDPGARRGFPADTLAAENEEFHEIRTGLWHGKLQ